MDCLTAHEDGGALLDDEALLERATQAGRVLFTHDDDLLRVADRWLRSGRSFAGLVYGHPFRVTIGQAIRDLALVAEIVEPHGMRNRIEFVPP